MSKIRTGGKSVQSYVSGQAICTFGNAALVKATAWSSVSRQRIHIQHILQTGDSTNDPTAAPFSIADKYMFDTLMEKSMCAADRLFDIGHQICTKMQNDMDAERQRNVTEGRPNSEHVDNTTEENEPRAPAISVFDTLCHPEAASVQPILCVGRIGCDEAEARLSMANALLISTDDRRVRSVRLHCAQLRSVALFPGQTVALRGRNPRGDTLYVEAVHAERQLQRAAVPCSLTAPLCVLVVSGPYTAADDLAYEPLHDMLAYCAANRPDVLVMLGPFVDGGHQMVLDGVLQETFESFFEKIVAEVMTKIG